MSLRIFGMVVLGFAGLCSIATANAQQGADCLPFAGAAGRTAYGPPPPARGVSHAISVKVPVPTVPQHGARPVPGGSACVPPASVPRAFPVRVEVAVKPDLGCKPELAPVAYRDPGPLRPLIANAVGLVGSTIALPFRLIETVLPLPSQGPCGSPSLRCPPPPAACRPFGPSIAPLPGPAGQRPCGPQLPQRLVQDRENPPCEPNSLLGGILGFPSRLVERGRLWGDLGRDSASPTY